jgi:hypothetical protein
MPPKSLDYRSVQLEDGVAWRRAICSILYWGILVGMVHSLELYSRNSSSSSSSSSSSDSSSAAAAAAHWGSDASAVTAFYSSSSSSDNSTMLQYLHAWAMAWPDPGGWWLAWWLFQQVTLLLPSA